MSLASVGKATTFGCGGSTITLEKSALGRAGTGGDREALLDQRDEPLLRRSLAPARQR